jgi:hypothetical protein
MTVAAVAAPARPSFPFRLRLNEPIKANKKKSITFKIMRSVLDVIMLKSTIEMRLSKDQVGVKADVRIIAFEV